VVEIEVGPNNEVVQSSASISPNKRIVGAHGTVFRPSPLGVWLSDAIRRELDHRPRHWPKLSSPRGSS
jgi:hypothetical protein